MHTFQHTLKRLALLLVIFISLSGFAPHQQAAPDPASTSARITQVDASKFPKVTVYISVTDGSGEPMPVSLANIELKENGEVMQPDEVGGAEEIGPLATMLVIDTSGSMNHGNKLRAAKDAAIAYVEQARPSDMIGLISFNTKIEYTRPLTSDHQAMIEAIESLRAQDDTAMYDALGLGIEYLSSVTGRKAVIVLTDGLDNRSKKNPLEVIHMIGPEGLSISTIGLGDPSQSTGALTSLNESALKSLAEAAGGAYGYANDAESLTALYQQLGRAMQSEYAITYTSPSRLRDGVNRSLSVGLIHADGQEGRMSAELSYNPGGLVPEVAQKAPWRAFAILLIGLVALLFTPSLISRLVKCKNGKTDVQQGGVKLAGGSAKPSGGKNASKVKLKN